MVLWQEKAIFVNFKKMILRSSQNPILAVQKSFFQTLTRLRFWLVDYVLRISYARYTYKKCLLESKQTFDIFWSIMRHVKVAPWQEKAIFVDFKKMMLRNSQNPILAFEKNFFQTSTRLRFCVVDCVLRIFQASYTYERCLFNRVQANFWYILEHHTTRTTEYFYKNELLKSKMTSRVFFNAKTRSVRVNFSSTVFL